MYYVYALKSKTKIYIGFTSDLERRLKQHLTGHTYTTKRMAQLKLIFYEAFLSKSDALRQENFYKSGYGREVLKDKLQNSIDEYYSGIV